MPSPKSKINLPFDKTTLSAIGNIFASYGVEDLVGVAILHKHFSLAQNTIMINQEFTSKPELINSSTPPLTGDSFFWDGTNFQAFEYSHGEALHLGTGFLTAFAAYLEAHQLTSRTALLKLDPELGYKLLLEYCDPETMSKICEEVNELSAAEPTEWKFEGGFPVVTRACARTYPGEHKKK